LVPVLGSDAVVVGDDGVEERGEEGVALRVAGVDAYGTVGVGEARSDDVLEPPRRLGKVISA